MHTYTYTYTDNTCIHTYACTFTYIHVHTNTCTRVHAHRQTDRHTHACVHINTLYVCAHVCTCLSEWVNYTINFSFGIYTWILIMYVHNNSQCSCLSCLALSHYAYTHVSQGWLHFKQTYITSVALHTQAPLSKHVVFLTHRLNINTSTV